MIGNPRHHRSLQPSSWPEVAAGRAARARTEARTSREGVAGILHHLLPVLRTVILALAGAATLLGYGAIASAVLGVDVAWWLIAAIGAAGGGAFGLLLGPARRGPER